MSLRHKNLGVLYLDSNNIVRFGFDGAPREVSGTDLLLQNVIVRLFTSTGSNGFEGEAFGGNLYSIIGGGYVAGDEDLLSTNFSLGFSAIEEQIKTEQAQQTNLPDDEKLDSLFLKSVEYNKTLHI